MGYVFISYSTKDQASAEAMRDYLGKHGIHTWMAPHDIPAGSKYAQVINQALRDCACLVLMLTNESQNSTWVAKEVERAIHYKKTVMPLQLEDVTLNDEFEFYISTDQIVPVKRIDDTSPALQKVLRSILVCLEQADVLPVIPAEAVGVMEVDLRPVRSFASCGKEGSVFKLTKGQDGCSVAAAVNFEPTRLRPDVPDFAGIYYLQHPVLDLRQRRQLRFEARSADGGIAQLQLEIKPKGRTWMHERILFELGQEYETFCVDTADFEYPETLACVEELTFVLTPESFANEDCLQGGLEIRNLQIL